MNSSFCQLRACYYVLCGEHCNRWCVIFTLTAYTVICSYRRKDPHWCPCLIWLKRGLYIDPGMYSWVSLSEELPLVFSSPSWCKLSLWLGRVGIFASLCFVCFCRPFNNTYKSAWSLHSSTISHSDKCNSFFSEISTQFWLLKPNVDTQRYAWSCTNLDIFGYLLQAQNTDRNNKLADILLNYNDWRATKVFRVFFLWVCRWLSKHSNDSSKSCSNHPKGTCCVCGRCRIPWFLSHFHK